MRKLPIIMIGSGAFILMSILLAKSASASTKSPGSLPGKKVDPNLSVAKYKAGLRAKVYDPAVLAEIYQWTKAKIIAEIDAIITNPEHAQVVKGVIEHETAGSWYPGTIAGYYNPANKDETDKATNSTAFGLTQVVKKTYNDVITKYPVPFAHDDLWYPPFAIQMGYNTLLRKGLGKKDLKTVLVNYAGGKEQYAVVVMSNMKDYA